MPTDHDAFTSATTEQWRAAYQAKIDDLARETRRTSALSTVIQRMHVFLSGAAKEAGYLPHQVRRFYRDGFPPEQREALLAAFTDEEREWVLADD